LSWLYLADLGIVNGLTNPLARAVALDDRRQAQAHVATAFWSLVGIAAVLVVVAGAAWTLVDWAALFNVKTAAARAEIAPAAAWAIGLCSSACTRLTSGPLTRRPTRGGTPGPGLLVSGGPPLNATGDLRRMQSPPTGSRPVGADRRIALESA
jgi:hypothetical protein